MPRFFPLSLGFLIAAGLGIVYLEATRQGGAEESPWDWAVPAAEPTVLVLLVNDRRALQEVLEASERHLLVSTPDALALRQGVIVATSAEAASVPLNRAGWVEREIEIFAPSTRERSPQAGRGASGGGAGGPTLADLAHKPTLTPGEALAALRLLDGMP